MGGVTTVRMAIGYHGFSHWPQFRPAVARRLAHVIKFSERPRSVRVNHPTPHYLGSDLRSPQHLTRPIRNETYMVAGGWGERSLVPSELRYAFDIPSWVHELPTGFPPIKILLASLEAFLASPPMEGPPPSGVPISRPSGRQTAVPDLGISPSRNPSGAPSLERHLGPNPDPSGNLMVPDVASSTYLPSLERCLPHSLADPSLVSTKAAKSDDAAVAFATWNQRILLVVLPRVDPNSTQVRSPPPSPTQNLDRSRQLFQQKQRRLIYLDFRRFMHLEYGSDWALTLRSARQLQRIIVASSEPPAPMRYKGGVGVGVAGSSSLLADAAQGAAALRSIAHSTWREWNLGSTLLFWRWGTALPRQHVRDGIPICVMGGLPKAPIQQRAPSQIKAPLLASKLDKVLERDYIRKGKVQGYID
jgi:hypothetical protein